MPSFEAVVYHKALPQGSKNAYKNKYTGNVMLVESVKGLKQARLGLSRELEQLAAQHGWIKPDKEIPITIETVFYYKRGTSVTREHHTIRPDGDKLQRFFWDSVTQAISIWVDDSQVTDWVGKKRYAPADNNTDHIFFRISY